MMSRHRDHMPTDLTIVTLTTGAQALNQIVDVVVPHLRDWSTSIQGAKTLYDLTQLVQDPDYLPAMSTMLALEEAGFTVDGQLADSIPDIVRAAVQGEGFNLRVVDPIRR